MWQFKERDWSWMRWIGVAGLVAMAAMLVAAGMRQRSAEAGFAVSAIAVIPLAGLWYAVCKRKKLLASGAISDERQRAIRDKCNFAALSTICLLCMILVAAALNWAHATGRKTITLDIGWLDAGFTFALWVYIAVYWGMRWWIRRQERPDVES